MRSTLSAIVRALALAFIVVGLSFTMQDDRAVAPGAPGAVNSEPAAPIQLAQGRCYNGRCF